MSVFDKIEQINKEHNDFYAAAKTMKFQKMMSFRMKLSPKKLMI